MYQPPKIVVKMKWDNTYKVLVGINSHEVSGR